MILWWFALYQTNESTPEWLTRAQAVCFGTNESGLPDTYGWMVLFLAPLSFLTALIVSMGSELRQGLRSFSQKTAGAVIMLVTGILLLAQCTWATGRIRSGLTIANADYRSTKVENLPENYPFTNTIAADFSLIDQHGTHISLNDLKSNTVILTFAFAHCKTVCPALVHVTKQALSELNDENTKLLVITLDPWRDTPGSLPTLAVKWGLGKNTHVLSGSVDDVNYVISSYNIPTKRNELDGDIIHPALVYVIDGDGNIAYTFNNPPPHWITQAIERLASGSSIRG